MNTYLHDDRTPQADMPIIHYDIFGASIRAFLGKSFVESFRMLGWKCQINLEDQFKYMLGQ